MSVDQDIQRIRACSDKLTLAVRSDPTVAERLVEEIDLLAAANSAPIFEAYRQRSHGHLLGIRGGMTDAVRHYRNALALFEKCNDQIEKARTASTLVGALVPLGEFDEALRLGQEARQVFQDAHLEVRAARVDVNLGNLYYRLNKLDEALLHYERAATFLEHSEDREAAAGVLINRSVVLMLLYRFDEALAGLLRASAFCNRHGLKVLATQAEYNRGYLLFLAGNYTAALRILKDAETGFRELGDEIHVAHCRADRAAILLELNLPEHALEAASLAEKGFRTSSFTVDRSRALLLLGRSLMRLHRVREAYVHYSTARELFLEDGNSIWAGMAELDMATTFMSTNRLQEAADLVARASEHFRSQKHAPFLAFADTLSARICLQLHDPATALQILSEYQQSTSPLPASIQYEVQYLKGRALDMHGDVENARHCFQRAIESLEFLMTHISADRAMVRFLEDKEDVYERLAVLTEDVHQALAIADNARNRALTHFRNSGTTEAPVSETARQLRESLRFDYLRLFQAGPNQPPQLVDKIRQLEHQLKHERLESDFGTADSRLISRESLELNVASDEVVLEYLVSNRKVFVFVVSAEGVERVLLPIMPDALQEEIDLTRYGLLSTTDPRREAALRFHLHRLFDTLIAPIKSLLRRRVVIIPHRFLHDLPFHILLSADGYFMEQHIISYTPSLRAYVTTPAREPALNPTSLIIGSDRDDLPAMRNEISTAARELPNCTVALNKPVEEIREAFTAAAVIHVATHAFFRADDPEWSLLHLGSDVLAAADLINLRVKAELVTVSACSTGRTRSEGNEVPGFVRAFSLWGVPSLIASLWEVNDETTALLMSSFYEGLRDSADIAEHLRQAMLTVKERYPHPAYWGGFVLIGRQHLSRRLTPEVTSTRLSA